MNSTPNFWTNWKEFYTNLLPRSEQVNAEVFREETFKHFPLQQTTSETIIVQQLFKMVRQLLRKENKQTNKQTKTVWVEVTDPTTTSGTERKHQRPTYKL